MIKAYRLTHIDNAGTERISQLLNSLRSVPFTVEQYQIESLLAKEGFSLFVAQTGEGYITGMLTLTACSTLTGDKVWIEDVIVDERFRGQGAGRALIRTAVDYARNELKASSIYLTSNPSRIAARALYRSEGFEEYETGVFRIKNLA